VELPIGQLVGQLPMVLEATHSLVVLNFLGKYAKWFFQYTFAATTATIVSGSIAERCQFVAYFIYSAAITGNYYNFFRDIL
jgi:ammonia channel protein AmtB